MQRIFNCSLFLHCTALHTYHAHHPCHQFSVVLSYSSRRRRAATKNHVHTFRSREKPSRGIGGECRVVNWKLNSTRCMYDPHRYCIKCKRRRRMWSRWGQITNLCICWYWFCTVYVLCRSTAGSDRSPRLQRWMIIIWELASGMYGIHTHTIWHRPRKHIRPEAEEGRGREWKKKN